MPYSLLIVICIASFVVYKVFVERKIKISILNKKWKSSWGDKKFEQYHYHLTQYNSYYNALSEEGKKKFVKRTYDFVHDINFYGKAGAKVTKEIKIAISATAVQLTFGHKEYLFPKFRYIFVYPEPFYSKMYKNYLKGGAYPSGAIAISWNYFVEGYKYDDGINLGLHEMAHTLLLQLSDDQFETYIDDWFTVSRKEFLNIQAGNSNMFRSYAGTNRHEFLAVAIECFFEQPEEFSKRLPEIYKGLKILLNQDPLNKEEDYFFESKHEIPSFLNLAQSTVIDRLVK